MYLFDTCQTRTPVNCLAETFAKKTELLALLHKRLKGCIYAACWCGFAFCRDRILVDMADAVMSFAAGSCRCYTLCVHSVHKSRHKLACSAMRPPVIHCWAPSGRGDHDMLKTASKKMYRLRKNDGICAHPQACDMLRSVLFSVRQRRYFQVDLNIDQFETVREDAKVSTRKYTVATQQPRCLSREGCHSLRSCGRVAETCSWTKR